MASEEVLLISPSAILVIFSPPPLYPYSLICIFSETDNVFIEILSVVEIILFPVTLSVFTIIFFPDDKDIGLDGTLLCFFNKS